MLTSKLDPFISVIIGIKEHVFYLKLWQVKYQLKPPIEQEKSGMRTKSLDQRLKIITKRIIN